jgi:hypothetical protein
MSVATDPMGCLGDMELVAGLFPKRVLRLGDAAMHSSNDSQVPHFLSAKDVCGDFLENGLCRHMSARFSAFAFGLWLGNHSRFQDVAVSVSAQQMLEQRTSRERRADFKCAGLATESIVPRQKM